MFNSTQFKIRESNLNRFESLNQFLQVCLFTTYRSCCWHSTDRSEFCQIIHYLSGVQAPVVITWEQLHVTLQHYDETSYIPFVISWDECEACKAIVLLCISVAINCRYRKAWLWMLCLRNMSLIIGQWQKVCVIIMGIVEQLSSVEKKLTISSNWASSVINRQLL